MLFAFVLGLQAAAAEPPAPAPAPPEVHYVRVGVSAAEERAMKVFAAHVEASGAAGRVRPAAIDPPPFERCVSTPNARLHRIDTECIRALVPETRPGEPPVVAIAIVEDRRSNITGRVVLKSHRIYCIGARSVGFETLNNPLGDLAPAFGVQRDVDKCIADALSVERQMATGEDGKPAWRYTYAPDRVAENALVARGSGDGIATIRVERTLRNRRGPCRVFGTIESVENGPALRRGDKVEIDLPAGCFDAHPMLAALDRPGDLVRLYGAWNGGIRFVEPAAAGGETTP